MISHVVVINNTESSYVPFTQFLPMVTSCTIMILTLTDTELPITRTPRAALYSLTHFLPVPRPFLNPWQPIICFLFIKLFHFNNVVWMESYSRRLRGLALCTQHDSLGSHPGLCVSTLLPSSLLNSAPRYGHTTYVCLTIHPWKNYLALF